MGDIMKIVLTSIGDETMTLNQEINMLKNSILYADNVDMYSLKANLLTKISRIKKALDTNDFSKLSPLFDFIQGNHFEYRFLLEYISKLDSTKTKGKRRMEPQEIIAMNSFKSELQNLKKEISPEFEKLIVDSNYSQFEPAINSGILTLKPFNAKINLNGDTEANTEEYFSEYLKILTKIFKNTSDYPYFDKNVGIILNEMNKKKPSQFSDIRKEHFKHVSLAGNLLNRLPNISNLTIEQTLELRALLKKPLINFRKSISKCSKEFKSEAWSEDFHIECNQLLIEKINPSINEIEELILGNNIFKKLIKNVATKDVICTTAATTGIGLGMTKVQDIVDSKYLICLPLIVGGGKNIISTYNEWKEKNSQIKNNEFYFYYGVKNYNN